jgi:hypothetical protein
LFAQAQLLLNIGTFLVLALGNKAKISNDKWMLNAPHKDEGSSLIKNSLQLWYIVIPCPWSIHRLAFPQGYSGNHGEIQALSHSCLWIYPTMGNVVVQHWSFLARLRH